MHHLFVSKETSLFERKIINFRETLMMIHSNSLLSGFFRRCMTFMFDENSPGCCLDVLVCLSDQ